MKKVLSLVLAAVMIMTLSSSAIYAAPNNNPNAAFNREKSAFENKVKNKTMNEGDEEALREQLRFTMLNGEGLPYGLAKRMELPPGLQMLFERGTLPYGIAKKLMDNYYPVPGKKTDLEVLEALIVTADAKVEVAVAADYKGGITTINTFKAAIVVAKDFVDEYVETQKSLIKPEIDKLKAAMKVFDDAKFVPEKLDEVKAILAKLMIYKTSYFDVLTPEKQVDLTNLIAFINTFTRTNDPVKLTKGDYDKIVLEAKLFSDPLTLLYVNLDLAKDLLEEDEADYLPGAHVKLEIAIDDVEDFLVGKTTSALILIVDEVKDHNENLVEAIEIFKDSELLGDAELAVLENLMASLQDIYDTTPSYNLSKLINKIDEYVDEEKVLTVGVYSDLLEASKVYISNLYVYLVAELEALIVDAEADMVDSTNVVAKAELVILIDEIEDYIDAEDYEYEVLVAFYNELLVAYNAL